MNTKTSEIYPQYQDFINGLSGVPSGQPRFFIDINSAKYSELHHHDYAELSFFIEGRGVEWIDSIKRIVKPGSVSFILPHRLHGLRSDENQLLYKYRMMFDLRVLLGSEKDVELSKLLQQVNAQLPPWIELNSAQRERMKSICDCLLLEYESPHSLEKSVMIRAKLTEAILVFIRACQQNEPEIQKTASSIFESSSKVWPILEYMHGNYSEALTLEKISELFNMSVPYISRLFKEYIGKGFIEYIHFLRVESAATLLRHTRLSITDIAIEVGFETSRTFTRVFRKLKGMSASEYRALDMAAEAELEQFDTPG